MTTEREEKIRQRAHEIWESEGRPHGQHDQHWEQARTEIDREAGGPTSEAAQMESMSGVSADPSAGRRPPRRSPSKGAAADGIAKTRKPRGITDGSDSRTPTAPGGKRSGPREKTSEGTKPDGAPPAQGRTTRRSAAKSDAEESEATRTDDTRGSASGIAEGSAPARKPRKSGATQDQ